MKTQSCKAKGRRLQQKIVADILEAFPHLQPDDVLSTSMGCGGEDVRMSPLARRSLPLSIEAKNQEKLNIWEAYSQASSNAPPNTTACVVFKKNNSDTYAMLPWKSLLYLYTKNVINTDEMDDTKKSKINSLLEELGKIINS